MSEFNTLDCILDGKRKEVIDSFESVNAFLPHLPQHMLDSADNALLSLARLYVNTENKNANLELKYQILEEKYLCLERKYFGSSRERTLFTQAMENGVEQSEISGFFPTGITGQDVPQPQNSQEPQARRHRKTVLQQKPKMTMEERMAHLDTKVIIEGELTEEEKLRVRVIEGKQMKFGGYQMVRNEVRRDSKTYIAEIRAPFWIEVKDENETAEEALASNEPVDSEAAIAEETSSTADSDSEAETAIAEETGSTADFEAEAANAEETGSTAKSEAETANAEEAGSDSGSVDGVPGDEKEPQPGRFKLLMDEGGKPFFYYGPRKIYISPSSPAVLPGCEVSVSLLADILTMKYVDALPSYRIEKILKRSGYPVTRATLNRWMIDFSMNKLGPVYDRLLSYLRLAEVVHADESYWQVHKEENKSNTSESRLWAFRTGRHEPWQVVYFAYRPDRNGENALEILGEDYSGYVIVDGFGGYNKLAKVVLCGCYAHVRRKFYDAMPSGATPKTSAAAKGVEFCDKLFALERKWTDLAPAHRLAARKEESAPIVDDFFKWVKSLRPLQGSKLATAVTYAINQEEHLRAFLTRGDLEISNAAAENAIRPFTVGRKNWLFSDSPTGAKSAAINYSFVECAKANNLEPSHYFEVLIDQARRLGSEPSVDELDRLLPWSPYMQATVRHA